MKPSAPLGSSAGYTYIAALVTVVILGIMSGQAAQVWKSTMQREKEAELIFRGMQIRDAMRRWYGMTEKSTTIAAGRPNLNRLEELLQDPTSPGKTNRYLRRLYKDPISGEDFALVKNSAQQVIGVASPSEKEPIKQGNFPLELDPADFEGKKKYSEWQFRCDRIGKGAKAGGVSGIDTSTVGGTTPENPATPATPAMPPATQPGMPATPGHEQGAP